MLLWFSVAPARRTGLLTFATAVLAALAACSSPPRSPDAAPAPRPGVTAPSTTPAPAAPPALEGPVVERPRSRWVATDWSALPGWTDDRTAAVWPALLRSCEKPLPAWAAFCREALGDALPLMGDDASARAFLEARLQPWRVEAADGNFNGMATGYFEPLVEAARRPQGPYRVPLHALPAELAATPSPARPWYSRRDLATLPSAQRTLAGREIAWLKSPLDLLLLQVQGSGRLQLVDAAPGSDALIRVAYAGHNGQPYQSVGRWLVDKGELTLEQASWPAIRAWAERNPRRLDEMMWANPRVVFFREEALPDPAVGPRGAQGVPLTPGRSVAVDPGSVPYGTPVWLDTTEPLSSTPLRRLVVAQDTGSAITGAVRVDYFWGWGDAAEAQAGRMKQPLRVWVLWPRR